MKCVFHWHIKGFLQKSFIFFIIECSAQLMGNTKSVVFIICGKINHPQKNTFITYKQLNKLNSLGLNWGKKIDQTRPRLKFCSLFRARLGPKFTIFFRAGSGQECKHAARAGPNTEKSGLYRPLMYACMYLFIYLN